MTKYNLIIGLNQNPLPGDCPICSRPVNANIGAELFLADTEQIVCLDCGSKHAPILACLITFADFSRALEINGQPLLGELLSFAELSELFKKAEAQFGDKWQDAAGYVGSSMNVYQDFGFRTEGING